MLQRVLAPLYTVLPSSSRVSGDCEGGRELHIWTSYPWIAIPPSFPTGHVTTTLLSSPITALGASGWRGTPACVTNVTTLLHSVDPPSECAHTLKLSVAPGAIGTSCTSSVPIYTCAKPVDCPSSISRTNIVCSRFGEGEAFEQWAVGESDDPNSVPSPTATLLSYKEELLPAYDQLHRAVSGFKV
eukprot:2413924-Rhodomonas_salina.1